MKTLQMIANDIYINGNWSKRAMKEGKKWTKKNNKDLQKYLTNLGINVENTTEYYCCIHNLVKQINWLADQIEKND